MNLFKISWSNLKDKKSASILSILLLSLGIGLVSLLLLLNRQLESQFNKNIKGIDMVVGAKGSPLQLILSSIYQIDSPTGNVSLSEVNSLKRNPFVKTVIPLSMGDSYNGFRIVGTTEDYVKHFEATLQEGSLFEKPLEATIGQKVAKEAGLKIGDSFSSSHGLDGEGDDHGDSQYIVTGIFEASGTVIDQLVLTSIESVWAIHNHEEEHSHDDDDDDEHEHDHNHEGAHDHDDHDHDHEDHDHAVVEKAEKEVTSALIMFRNPMGLIALPRQINENTSMQAALPSIEINRLFSLLGVGIDTLKVIALIIIIIAGISVFISLYNSLKERKYEMALMLSMGATRMRLFLMLLSEGIILAVIGFLTGILLSRIGMYFFNLAAEKDYHYSLANFSIVPEEITLFLGALALGILAAIIPSLSIYRINISRTLAED